MRNHARLLAATMLVAGCGASTAPAVTQAPPLAPPPSAAVAPSSAVPPSPAAGSPQLGPQGSVSLRTVRSAPLHLVLGVDAYYGGKVDREGYRQTAEYCVQDGQHVLGPSDPSDSPVPEAWQRRLRKVDETRPYCVLLLEPNGVASVEDETRMGDATRSQPPDVAGVALKGSHLLFIVSPFAELDADGPLDPASPARPFALMAEASMRFQARFFCPNLPATITLQGLQDILGGQVLIVAGGFPPKLTSEAMRRDYPFATRPARDEDLQR